MFAVDARTICAYAGSRWMNKPCTKVLSVAAAQTASNCCILRKVFGCRAPQSAAIIVEIGAGRKLLFA